MSTTKVLREQSGIQYQGVQDKSEADPRDSLINVVFLGQFKRGRVDRPFKVTKANYRAKLGNDPKGKDFQAVEDALNVGVPFVWVQRVQSTKQLICSRLDTGNSVNYAVIENANIVDEFVKNMTLKLILSNENDGFDVLELPRSEYSYSYSLKPSSNDGGEGEIEIRINHESQSNQYEIEVCSTVPFLLGTWN